MSSPSSPHCSTSRQTATEVSAARKHGSRIALVPLGALALWNVVTLHNAVAVEPVKVAPAEAQASEVAAASNPTVSESLTPRMRGALDYAAKRYRVSQEALEPVFLVVQKTAKELALDPLLIVAVIAVESRFNPLSQSESGAQGLMQLIPRYHREKLPAGAGKLPFFDPAINVRLGSMVLKDFIRRGGGVVAGLQLFAGETSDTGQAYSARVLAEKDRLELASRHVRPGAARQAESPA